MSRSIRTTPSDAPSVAPRVRSSFRFDAMYEMFLGLALMGNPMMGPKFPVSSWVIGLAWISILVYAIFLGGGGLGKGPLANRLIFVCLGNGLVVLASVALSVSGTLTGGAREFVLVAAVIRAVVLGTGIAAIVRPFPNIRPASTASQRRAALSIDEPNSVERPPVEPTEPL